MDDRLQKIQLNNPIPLHFYEVGERLPDDDSAKIVIAEDGYFEFAYYDKFIEEWCLEWSDERIVFDVIAWASFSPGWVTGG